MPGTHKRVGRMKISRHGQDMRRAKGDWLCHNGVVYEIASVRGDWLHVVPIREGPAMPNKPKGRPKPSKPRPRPGY